jgi:hypothetical protein
MDSGDDFTFSLGGYEMQRHNVTRFVFVAAACLVATLSGCSVASPEQRVSPRISFRKALKGLEGVQSISDLQVLLGPPHGEAVGNFQDPSDPVFDVGPSKDAIRYVWLRRVFVPHDLVDRLPKETKAFGYEFAESGGKRVGGVLEVYFDMSGTTLGWSYPPALTPHDDGGPDASLVDVGNSR